MSSFHSRMKHMGPTIFQSMIGILRNAVASRLKQ